MIFRIALTIYFSISIGSDMMYVVSEKNGDIVSYLVLFCCTLNNAVFIYGSWNWI